MTMEGFEYHIRRKKFSEAGYRLEFYLEDFLAFFCQTSESLEIIDELDFNLRFNSKGKLCISQESGFIHIFFEEGEFTENESLVIVNMFKDSLSKSFEEEVECFRSY